MSITLFHHPRSRAVTVVWMLEELGLDYTLQTVDLQKGEQRDPDFLAKNPMGKLPTLVDGDGDGAVVITECAAIGLYLADRYSLGELAPAPDDPARATYLRWILFGPSVVEPCAYAKGAGWEYQPGSAGWGSWESMIASLESAVTPGPWILGERFSMADVCLGATIRFLLRFGMLPADNATIVQYANRLGERAAVKRTAEVTARTSKALGL